MIWFSAVQLTNVIHSDTWHVLKETKCWSIDVGCFAAEFLQSSRGRIYNKH